MCGGNRIRTCEDISQRIYSPSQLAALVFPQPTLLLNFFQSPFSCNGWQNYTLLGKIQNLHFKIESFLSKKFLTLYKSTLYFSQRLLKK